MRAVLRRGSLSSGWSFVRVFSRYGGPPSGWFLIGVVSRQGFHCMSCCRPVQRVLGVSLGTTIVVAVVVVFAVVVVVGE